ncbi:MAG: GTPase of the G3E family [Candidatus Alkanophagales archaeon MCA70_species_2]|nr:GTPase of the G3E family [Candidatus Alkanophaga liquidiphilum]
MGKDDVDVLVHSLLSGDRKALARLITLVENRPQLRREIVRRIHSYTGHAYVVGITGAPGSGKSTLVDKLTGELRARGKTVGIIAIDPTSPFTGGAILGDRIRMQSKSTDEGVFIRSMSTRGSLGGLSRAAHDAISLLDAFGKDFIIVETVGTGQAEVDIVDAAHTSIVVVTPGMGDEIQAIKAGILEIADIFVVNKADLENVDATVMALEMMLDMSDKKDWRPPIIKTIATAGVGIKELLHVIERHRAHICETNEVEKTHYRRSKVRVLDIVRSELMDRLMKELERGGELDDIIKCVVEKKTDPYSAAENIIMKLKELKRV